ncbi:MAG: hypothetical protein ONB16_06955 [candidate division KSB1 bacterium]|nr:hypothetical protein [candidate division KSB1 bacterium]MDZ7318559.1 hypothetical protein [candidate division KSB1 bacterium]MDZ7342549.1 hypothetical protein [candidate division KSB1 bacterium]
MEYKDYQLQLTVNQEPVALNAFAHEIVRNVVLALIQSLTLKTPPKQIEITVTKSN